MLIDIDYIIALYYIMVPNVFFDPKNDDSYLKRVMADVGSNVLVWEP